MEIMETLGDAPAAGLRQQLLLLDRPEGRAAIGNAAIDVQRAVGVLKHGKPVGKTNIAPGP